MSNETTMQIRLDKTLKKAFLEAAECNDRSGSQLLRDYMRKYIKENNQKEMKL